MDAATRFPPANPELTQIGLASQRTRLSFHRTRMAADRSLLAIMRTSLSLVGFGFTAYQFLHVKPALLAMGPRADGRILAFGLVLLGTVFQVIGMGKHIGFMRELRREREQLSEDGMLHLGHTFPRSSTLIIATGLLILAFLAIAVMALQAFGN